jgi:hypothetical protein
MLEELLILSFVIFLLGVIFSVMLQVGLMLWREEIGIRGEYLPPSLMVCWVIMGNVAALIFLGSGAAPPIVFTTWSLLVLLPALLFPRFEERLGAFLQKQSR